MTLPHFKAQSEQNVFKDDLIQLQDEDEDEFIDPEQDDDEDLDV